jgi:hypothetical protein
MAEQSKFAKMRDINSNVDPEMIEEVIKWLDQMGSRADGFFDALDRGAFYKISSSKNAPHGGIQVWCNEDGGCVDGPGHTPNHELWRKGDGTFEIVDGLAYG